MTRSSLFFFFAFCSVLLFCSRITFSAVAQPTNVHNATETSEIIFNRTEVPDGWILGEHVSGHTLVNMSINLRPRNLDVAEELLRNISDPAHPRYGQHLTAQELDDLVAPNASVIAQVNEWLSHHSVNISSVRLVHTALYFSATANVIENVFNTTLHWYTHNASNERVVVQYGGSSIPRSINSFVSGVVGLNDFPIMTQHYSVRHIQILPVPGTSSTNTDNGHVDETTAHTFKTNAFNHRYYAPTNLPQTAINLYGLPDHSNFRPGSNFNPTTSHAVAQFPVVNNDQSFSPADLLQYGNSIGYAADLEVANENIVGSNRPSTPGPEGTLDIQATVGINPTAKGWFYIVPIGAWMLEFTNTFLSTPGPLPQVVSISYGGLEETTSYVDNADANFLLMGLRGVTVVVATGDDGANQGAAFGKSCAQAYATSTKLHVSWPASSPYVLSVGATEIDPYRTTFSENDAAPLCGQSVPQYSYMDVGFYCIRNGSEIAASITNSGFTSAGGFSRKYARPSWQSRAVEGFVRSSVAKPPSNYYDTTKRATPDVAALGSNWAIVINNTPFLIGGTSLSAPIWAGIISMLNAETLRLNGTTLGFINPLIYEAYDSDPTIFNDITSGDSICPIHKSCTSCVGWTATAGWDPITGLGSPNYSKLLRYITNRITASRPPVCQPQYSWTSSAWSTCSGNCYNPTTRPTQTRTVRCTNSCGGATVADSFCSASTRPATSQSCRPSNLCFAQWSTNPTGTCSKTCGGGQLQLVSTCRQSTTSTDTNINMVNVDNSMCQQFTGYVPPTSQVCNNFQCPQTPTCTYQWQTTSFGRCSMGCYTPAAPAVQNRSVTCRSTCTSGSTTTTATVADSYCSAAGTKPSPTQSCSSGLPNCYADWVTEYLTQCTRSCGGGTRTQYVGCWQQQGGDGTWENGYIYAEVANSICTSGKGYTPSTTVTCNPQRC